MTYSARRSNPIWADTTMATLQHLADVTGRSARRPHQFAHELHNLLIGAHHAADEINAAIPKGRDRVSVDAVAALARLAYHRQSEDEKNEATHHAAQFPRGCRHCGAADLHDDLWWFQPCRWCDPTPGATEPAHYSAADALRYFHQEQITVFTRDVYTSGPCRRRWQLEGWGLDGWGISIIVRDNITDDPAGQWQANITKYHHATNHRPDEFHLHHVTPWQVASTVQFLLRDS